MYYIGPRIATVWTRRLFFTALPTLVVPVLLPRPLITGPSYTKVSYSVRVTSYMMMSLVYYCFVFAPTYTTAYGERIPRSCALFVIIPILELSY